MYRPKSRTELYKEKLKERDLYTNNVLDQFTENGGGAPLRNKDGTIMTKRRTMLNNDYEDIYLNQRNRTPISYNYNQQINSLQEMNSNMSSTINNNMYGINEINNNDNNYNNNFYQTLPVGIIDNNVYNMKNININQTENENNIINNNTNENNNNEYQNQIQRQTFERRPRSQMNYNNNINTPNNQYNNTNNNYRPRNEGRDYDHYEGTGVILKDENMEENNRRKYRNLREEWLKEIEEKKEREALRKKREREEEFKLEEKYRKEQEEEKERERLEKYRLNENLRNINNTNLMMMKNNKKKKNELIMEDSNNINNINNNININNYNNQEGMLMNGNNLEPIQNNIQENKIINENETASQNFGIIRDQNNIDINNNNFNQMNDMDLYSNNPQDLDDNINMQIAKLRDDVNSQYIEMSNLFGKLKMDVIEATQLKNEAEKELQYIRKELAKNKMASLAYDAELNQVLEKHAPYNNLHINIKDVDPLYSLRNVRKDIQTTSNMIYNTDMINEQNVNRVKQLSALAQAGQNLVGLKAESEFIPINGPTENNNNNEYNNEINNNMMGNDPKNNIAISKTEYKNLDNESYPIYQQDNNKESELNNEPKILDDYMNKGEYSEMYKQLVDIANINHEMGAENKLKTLNKNYDVDFNNFNQKHSQQQKKIINNFDQLLNEIN